MYNYHESVYLAGLTTIHDKGWIKMKYIVVLTDGAADYKIDALGGKTVYEKGEFLTIDVEKAIYMVNKSAKRIVEELKA